MGRDRGQLKLGLSLVSNGTHLAGWRYGEAQADAALDIRLWKRIAQAAEAAKIQFIFLADGAAVRINARDNATLSYNGRIEQFEPLTLIAALSAVTERIGFVATASTTYNEPYTIARKFASLDYISEGRVGWNVVTSWSEAEAKNFNRDAHLEHGTRYRRAEEFFDVVTGLWDSWDDDAFLRDKQSGRYFDPDKLHVLNHKGENFAVRGPLNVCRPIQGYPIIAQAGASDTGQELAARTADLIYTAQLSRDGAQKFYAEQKARLAKYGRAPEDVHIMPGVMVVVGDTEAQAREKLADMERLIHPKIGLQILDRTIGDVSGYPLDGPVPDVCHKSNVKSIADVTYDMAQREGLTIRQLYTKLAGGSGHRQVVGTPQSVADQLEDWFINDACDGFNIMVPYFPQGFTDVLEKVIPELQRRGLFWTDYRGATLRENLGLARPVMGSRRALSGRASAVA